MKAWVVTRYGGPEVLELRNLPRPRVDAGGLLIRVKATTVTAGDRRIRALDAPRGFGPLLPLVFGFGRPRQPVMGSEAAGIVEEVGPGANAFKVGDRVFAFSDLKLGAHAEYLLVPKGGAIAAMPGGASFEEAACLGFGPCTALAFLRKTKVAAGDRVLINSVTAVTSAANADLLRAIGAADTIDYRTQDFANQGRVWDVIIDTVGNLDYRRSRPAMAPGGRLGLAVADLPSTLAAPFQSLMGLKVVAGPTGGTSADLAHMAGLVASGAYRPVIDSVLSFDRLPEAHRIADGGRKRGSVVLTL
jgi:NADPH:quinone reductase-like Zn-dependent oxidoreductase